MRPHRIILFVNQIMEHGSNQIKKPTISLQNLLAASLCKEAKCNREDIFIGEQCNWKNVSDRLEDYRHLSYLREGKLEIIYVNLFNSSNERFTSDSDRFYDFYDCCLKKESIEEELLLFHPNFNSELRKLDYNWILNLTEQTSLKNSLTPVFPLSENHALKYQQPLVA